MDYVKDLDIKFLQRFFHLIIYYDMESTPENPKQLNSIQMCSKLNIEIDVLNDIFALVETIQTYPNLVDLIWDHLTPIEKKKSDVNIADILTGKREVTDAILDEKYQRFIEVLKAIPEFSAAFLRCPWLVDFVLHSKQMEAEKRAAGRYVSSPVQFILDECEIELVTMKNRRLKVYRLVERIDQDLWDSVKANMARLNAMSPEESKAYFAERIRQVEEFEKRIREEERLQKDSQ